MRKELPRLATTELLIFSLPMPRCRELYGEKSFFSKRRETLVLDELGVVRD